MHRLLLSLLAVSAPLHGATLEVCPAGADAPARAFVSAGGGEAAAGCRRIELGIDAARVEAVYPLPADARPEQTILLQGDDSKGALAISEHTLVPSPPQPEAPAPMPFGDNLLTSLRVRSFGVEERVQARLEDGRLRIACKAGTRPAGVLLGGPWYLPRAEAALQVVSSGGGQFLWQVADEAHAAREGALDMGTLSATRKPATGRLTLPAALERGAWRQFAVLCPAQAATLDIDRLSLEPLAATRAPRATWIWQQDEWRARGQALVEWAARERVGELFITVPLREGRVHEPEALAAFVKAAGARGIAVTAVDGDPHMVLPGEQAPTAARARAYAAYNEQAEPAARLKGMQFDVEPYLLPAHVLPPAERDRRYLELAARLRQAAGPMRLEFVVPFWWDSKPELLRELAKSADALSVMDYRTDPQQIYRFAVPFLDWAETHGKQVRIALEAGPIGTETQRRYRRASKGSAGDMLLFELEGQQVLVLLRQPAAHAKAQAFTLAGSRTIDGSATTFHADKAALTRLLPKLEATFGAWKGFGGIALHEWR